MDSNHVANYGEPVVRLLYDYLGAGGLLLVAYFACSGWKLGPRRARQFSLVASAGGAYLAFDEAFSLHERLGTFLYNRGWREPAGINHVDDVIALAIGCSALITAGFFASEILRDSLFAKLFAAGLCLLALAVAWDSTVDQTGTFTWWAEETLELAGVLVMALAFGVRASRLRNLPATPGVLPP